MMTESFMENPNYYIRIRNPVKGISAKGQGRTFFGRIEDGEWTRRRGSHAPL
jgi:hypothetical protein